MKNIDEIKSFSEWDDEVEQGSLHDSNAIALESEGHKVICVGRSIATIEQCETSEDSPIDNSDDAIKITIHADKDLAPDEPPHEIFIAANRWGSSVVKLKIGNKVLKAKWIEDIR